MIMHNTTSRAAGYRRCHIMELGRALGAAVESDDLRLVQADLQWQLGNITLPADGRVPHGADVPQDLLVAHLEGELGEQHGQDDFCKAAISDCVSD